MKYFLRHMVDVIFIIAISSIIGFFIYNFGISYAVKDECFNDASALRVATVAFLISASLMMGMLNTIRIIQIRKICFRISEKVDESIHKSDIRYDSLCHRLQNNREIELDIFHEVKGVDNNEPNKTDVV